MNDRVVIFVGPTLLPEEVHGHLDAVCAPPVSQGDVYRVSLDRPWAIGIIDGYFERVPAVWHKEILWAMSRGIHVFGAASMGAIRAAELAAYGMVGLGKIFGWFHDGTFTDDDEVAVRHEAGANGFKAVSEAMVNIRVTLAEAVRAGLISDATHGAMIAMGKRSFYADRTYPALMERARAAALDADDLDRLLAWLPRGRVDQKRQDAVEMLEHIAHRAAGDRAPMRPAFTFEHTDMWEQVGRAAGGLRRAKSDGPQLSANWRDEFRLSGPAVVRDLSARALQRAVALEEARRQGVIPNRDQIAERAMGFRSTRALGGDEAFREWLSAERLSEEAFLALMADEVRLEQVRALYEPETAEQICGLLRLEGRYGALLERAEAKQELMTRQGLNQVGLEGSGISVEGLLEWFFVECLGGELPEDLDACSAQLGFADRDALLQVLLREWWYRRLMLSDAPPAA